MSRDQCKEEEWRQFRKKEVPEKKQFNLEKQEENKKRKGERGLGCMIYS